MMSSILHTALDAERRATCEANDIALETGAPLRPLRPLPHLSLQAAIHQHHVRHTRRQLAKAITALVVVATAAFGMGYSVATANASHKADSTHMVCPTTKPMV